MRVPNYKLDRYFANLAPVENYNGTIKAYYEDGAYVVKHWQTIVFAYDPALNLVGVRSGYISNTTSHLIGRIVRNLPDRKAIDKAIAEMPKGDAKRFLAMLRR
jgi:hypothetical protein